MRAATRLRRAYALFPVLEEFRRRPRGRPLGRAATAARDRPGARRRPEVLLLDEPSLGLAPLAVESVFEALRGIREDGITILLVEQRGPSTTVGLADRTHVLVERRAEA